MAKTKTTISVGEIEAKYLIFADKDNGRWVVSAQRLDYIKFQKRFASDYKDGLNWKQASGHARLDDSYETKFWAVAVDDCMDPPVAIIRAEHADHAIDIFVDEFTWAHVSDEDLEDYREPEADEQEANLAKIEGRPAPETETYSDAISFNSNGQAYLNEDIVMWQVKLIRVEME